MLLSQSMVGMLLAVIGSNGCDFSISEGIQEVKSLVVSQGKRVLLIVIQALAAGKDFGRLKEKIRFGIESRNRQLANGARVSRAYLWLS